LNTLYYGDNLPILKKHFPDESIDLIYLDPPFNSNRSYNVLFKDEGGKEADAQIKAFDDSWHWTQDTERLYNEIITASLPVSGLISALRFAIGTNQMMAYLVMMTARLTELHRVLKSIGSLYLHCDPTASHYLKIVMDAIFGVENFRNEITWQRTGAHNDAKRWGRVSDTILFYSKTNNYLWNNLFLPYEDDYIQERYHYREEDTGRLFWPNTMTAAGSGPSRIIRGIEMIPPPGTHWRYSQEEINRMEKENRIYYSAQGKPYVKSFLDEREGKSIQDIWTDIVMTKSGAERLGYPTQKPVILLERIIKASSNPGDVVLDPFCGCGTAIVAAQKLNRQWIGIDITHLSIALMKYRLVDSFGLVEKKDYLVVGEPEDLPSARQLAIDDRYQFQWWALSLIKARPFGDKKKGADRGVDGLICFVDDNSGKAKRAFVQVKSGHVNSANMRDLVGVLDREKAEIGILITLEESTKDMRTEAISAGFYHSDGWNQDYPRVQIITIEQLLKGEQIKLPPNLSTFKKAPVNNIKSSQESLQLVIREKSDKT